uniref:Uncharacterized protein n=1 Tax=Molossus molossus TaxID=27622 RepID=A0A7J8ER89_MOLMO|nr:hypothetical protein HJG59_008649 [Molossus molossus]
MSDSCRRRPGLLIPVQPAGHGGRRHFQVSQDLCCLWLTACEPQIWGGRPGLLIGSDTTPQLPGPGSPPTELSAQSEQASLDCGQNPGPGSNGLRTASALCRGAGVLFKGAPIPGTRIYPVNVTGHGT